MICSVIDYSKLKLAPANLNQLSALYNIENQAKNFAWTQQMLSSSINSQHIFSVLSNDQKIIGFYILLDCIDCFEILNIVIAPSYQSKGLGSYLLSQLFIQVKSANQNKIFLEVRVSNQSALNFYLKHGFEEVSRRKNYYPTQNGKEDGIIMVKNLA